MFVCSKFNITSYVKLDDVAFKNKIIIYAKQKEWIFEFVIPKIILNQLILNIILAL